MALSTITINDDPTYGGTTLGAVSTSLAGLHVAQWLRNASSVSSIQTRLDANDGLGGYTHLYITVETSPQKVTLEAYDSGGLNYVDMVLACATLKDRSGNLFWHAGNDGSGSGLDADLLDGQSSAYYLASSSYTAADVLSKLLTVDGSGSGLDADTVDGVHAAAGTYTPTLSNTTNVAASTAYPCQYLRVGNTVTVSGKVDIDPTAGGATVLGISLPIASNFSSDEQAGGHAALSGGASQENGVIYADAANDRANLGFYAVTTTNSAWYFTFTYRVI